MLVRTTQLKTRTTVFLFATLFAAFAGILITAHGQVQKKVESAPASSLCNQESALEIIKQQMDVTRTFDDRVQRIAVLITTADLLWPYQNDQARVTFTEAFDLGTQEFKERG